MVSDLKSTVASVKEACDIVDEFKKSGHHLKTAGVGKWKTCCPFHQEKTPSCIINESFQNFHCFGCGESGDVISFVSKTENLTFKEALTKLAEENNVEIDVDDSSGVDYRTLYDIVSLSAKFYCSKFNDLLDDHAAKREIASRGLTFDNFDNDAIKYGYAPAGNALYTFLSGKGFRDESIVESGVCRRSDKGFIYDFFRSRLMFIFTDRNGKPVGFSSRKLFDDDTRGKYVNSPESPLFHKSNVLFNHSLARKNTRDIIFIVEGQFDVSAFVSAGLKNVVAASGTAFTRDHARECAKMGEKLVFCFDGDSAGKKAAAKVFSSLPEFHSISYVVSFPEGVDPCDYRFIHGDEALRNFVESSQVSLVEFMILSEKDNHDMSSVVGRSNYVEKAASIIKTIKDRTLKDNCVKLLSLEALTPLSTVREAVSQAKDFNFGTFTNRTKEEPQKDDNLVERVKMDDRFYASACFLSLGMTRKSWRESVVRSKDLLPKVFSNFVDNLDELSDRDVVVPEMFDDEKMANYLMSTDFSTFYKFMSMEELKNQFIYLHKELATMKEERKEKYTNTKMMELLSNADDDIPYLRALLEKTENFRKLEK